MGAMIAISLSLLWLRKQELNSLKPKWRRFKHKPKLLLKLNPDSPMLLQLHQPVEWVAVSQHYSVEEHQQQPQQLQLKQLIHQLKSQTWPANSESKLHQSSYLLAALMLCKTNLSKSLSAKARAKMKLSKPWAEH